MHGDAMQPGDASGDIYTTLSYHAKNNKSPGPWDLGITTRTPVRGEVLTLGGPGGAYACFDRGRAVVCVVHLSDFWDLSVLGSWVKPRGTRQGIRKGGKGAIRLPKIQVLTCCSVTLDRYASRVEPGEASVVAAARLAAILSASWPVHAHS